MPIQATNVYLTALIVLIASAVGISEAISDDSATELYYSMGQKYIDQGDFELAVLSLKKAVTAKPDWAEAHNTLGMAYYQLFRFEEAITEFDKAIQLKAYYTEAKINRNRAMRSLERYAPVNRGLGLWAKLAIVFGIAVAITATTIIILNTRN